ncbi:hypothetical protein AX16_008817 [Volvariella volvacea WC 439]|nr:hypothetical protein AX16_008817 [Volvariella volvacea WC 439]
MDAHKPEATPEVAPVVPFMTPQSLLLASLGFAVVLVAILVLLSKRKAAKQGKSLLLLGPSDSGKTAILSTLAYGQTLSTHSSLQVNSSLITLSEGQKSISVVDVPGHPRLRDHFREHINDAKVVAFVVDANLISRNGAVVAEHLHLVLHSLSSLPPSQKPPTLVVVAHKSDLMRVPAGTTSPTSVAINRVRSVLERELEKRRASHAGGVGVEGLGEEGETEMGGLECTNSEGVFRFEDWEGGEVSFVGTHVHVGEKAPPTDDEKAVDGLQELKDWLLENM